MYMDTIVLNIEFRAAKYLMRILLVKGKRKWLQPDAPTSLAKYCLWTLFKKGD